jgi:hypothetical protein
MMEVRLLFLLSMAIVAFAIIGLHETTRKDSILGFVERFWLRIGDPWWASPITECPYCMASVWGTLWICLVHLHLLGPTVALICLIPTFIFAINGLIHILRP